MKDLESRAALFAAAAHAAVDQRRKYTGEPYIQHPAAVAQIVRSVVGNHAEMLAAAWLHDVVEDTEVTLELIRKEFGPCVAALVEGLTDVSKPSDGNRAARKAIDRQHMAEQSPACKTIKLADLIHNSQSILAYDLAFARVYLAEKQALLEVLREGDRTLWDKAKHIVDAGLRTSEAQP